MPRVRLLSLALLAAATLAACGTPTAPAPAAVNAPSLDEGTAGDTTTNSRSGFQVGHG